MIKLKSNNNKKQLLSKKEKGEISMKRMIIVSILTMIITGIICAGCSKSTKENTSVSLENTPAVEDNQEQTVNLLVWGAEEDQALLQQIIDSFQKEYDGEAEFNITIAPVSEGTCKETVLSNVAECADVFTFADDQLMALAAAGVLKPIENADQIKANNIEGAVTAATINNSLYAYPLTSDNGYFMFYNKKYFSDSDLESLDSMLRVAAENGKYVTMDWNSGWYLYSFFGNTGLEMGLNDDGITNYCNWNTKKGDIKGVDVASAMLAIAKNPGFKNGSDEVLAEGAKDGSVIAGISGVWEGTKLKEAWGEDYAAVKLPTYTCNGEQVQMGSYVGYKMVGVNSYSKNKEWAAKLAEWITNEENQELRFKERGQGPSNINASASDEVKNDAAIMALIQQSQYASLQRVGGKYWDAMASFGVSMANGELNEKPLQEVMDSLVESITATN